MPPGTQRRKALGGPFLPPLPTTPNNRMKLGGQKSPRSDFPHVRIPHAMDAQPCRASLLPCCLRRHIAGYLAGTELACVNTDLRSHWREVDATYRLRVSALHTQCNTVWCELSVFTRKGFALETWAATALGCFHEVCEWNRLSHFETDLPRQLLSAGVFIGHQGLARAAAAAIRDPEDTDYMVYLLRKAVKANRPEVRAVILDVLVPLVLASAVDVSPTAVFVVCSDGDLALMDSLLKRYDVVGMVIGANGDGAYCRPDDAELVFGCVGRAILGYEDNDCRMRLQHLFTALRASPKH